MAIKTIIFDLGGTLIEYAGPYAVWPDLERPGLTAAYNALANKGGYTAKFREVFEHGF